MVPRPEILDLAEEIPRHKRRRYRRRKLGSIKYIVVHHGAVPGDGRERLISYARYHVEQYGWPGIGYHFGISKDGLIYQTQPLETISYHLSEYNSKSVGLVLIGHYDIEDPPEPQIKAGQHLCAYLAQELGLKVSNIKGHREFPHVHKTCPGLKISMSSWREAVERLLRGEEEVPKAKIVFEGREIPAIIREGRTYAPVRELAELLELSVGWDPRERTVILGRKLG